MTYQDFARRIGLIQRDGKWEAPHRGQISKILYITGAMDKAADVKELTDDDFSRIVGAQSGAPGAGHRRKAAIMTSPPAKK